MFSIYWNTGPTPRMHLICMYPRKAMFQRCLMFLVNFDSVEHAIKHIATEMFRNMWVQGSLAYNKSRSV